MISDYPGKIEDVVGRPFAGQSGKYLRNLVKQWWDGPVAFDNGIRCAPGMTEVKPKHVNACRTYGAQVLIESKPKRIIAMGGSAIQSVLGRRPPVMSVRKGYGWFIDQSGNYIPVFLTMNPAAAIRNRFMAAAFESDLKWALQCETPKPSFKNKITYLVEGPKGAQKAFDKLIIDPPVTYDTETFGKVGNPDFRIECVTFWGWRRQEGWTFTRKAMKSRAVKEICRKLLEAAHMCAQNGKYDDGASLDFFDADVKYPEIDTRLNRKMLEPDTRAGLELLAEYVGMGGHKKESDKYTAEICKELRRLANPPSKYTPKGKLRKIRPPKFHVEQSVLDQIKLGEEPMSFAFGYVPDEVLYRYNARDTLSTRLYAKKTTPKFRADEDIFRMWEEVVKNANKAVRWIEHWGIAVDKGSTIDFAEYCQMKTKQALDGMHQYADFNPRSPQQLSKVLFQDLGLPTVKKTKSEENESTDAEVIEVLEGKHPIIAHLKAFRKYDRLDTNYATGMLPWIRADGRIHPSLLLDGTETGRLSSRDPNLQNIPRAQVTEDNKDAKLARNIFVASKGCTLVEADFSQLELRIGAMLANDKVMIQDFKDGIDIHSNGAALCCQIAWGISPEKWAKMTKEERAGYRSQIKAVIFGKFYGKGNKNLADEFGVKVSVIESINDKIWGRYRRLDEWTDECKQYTRRTGFAWTWWNGHRGRRRPLWKIADHDDAVRNHAENASVNTPVQGTAAEFATASLWPLVKWILDEGVPAKLVLTVHDSILIDADNSVVDEVKDKMREVMTGHRVDHGVPLVVDFKLGEKWGEMEEIK